MIKTSEFTPFTALALGVLAERAGFPAGAVNIATGDEVAVGGALTGSSAALKLSFTGSTRVGKLLMEQSAGTMKRLSLELGGNAPFIIFNDADLDLAIEGVMASKFRNGGQKCVCANRIYVQAGVYDAFAEKLAAVVGNMKLGDGFDEGVEIGPMINERMRQQASHSSSSTLKMWFSCVGQDTRYSTPQTQEITLQNNS